MNRRIVEKLEKILAKSNSLTIGELEPFVHETLKFFEDLKHIIETGSEKEQKEAMAIAAEVQQKFQALGDKIYKKMGLNPDQMAGLMQPGNFASDDWKVYQNVQKEIEDYKKNQRPGTSGKIRH